MTPSPPLARLSHYLHRTIAAEVSAISEFYDRLVQYNPLPGDSHAVFEEAICPEKVIAHEVDQIPNFQESTECGVVLINGNFNHDLDIQNTLGLIKTKLSRTSRLVAVLYNPYLAWVYSIATALGIRTTSQPTTFVTEVALKNLAAISGYELVRLRPTAPCPFKLLGIGDLINKIVPILPLFRWLSLTAVAVLRPVVPEVQKPSLSIIVAARNERGNIEDTITRLDHDASDFEVIFVEGHSTDGTWEEIQRVSSLYGNRLSIKAFQQSGEGKADAIRLGFSQASKELFVVQDADLTMPPELIGRFYRAYCEGLGDCINGSRLVYPIEGEAMRFLNLLGNVFFAKTLTAVLGVELSDSLCCTKLFSRDAYRLMLKWRKEFGDFDPFGDFELLFPAAQLALGIKDVPIRYRDRTYGQTNIRRFYHGMLLLKMTLIGFIKIKLGRTPSRKKAGRLTRNDQTSNQISVRD